ncbi:MAG TPA: hypothetical protein VGR92_20860 [Steroidobacteraceae bacterium]|nr:hypothetical protein [Steroidobacteraceae bacterium]
MGDLAPFVQQTSGSTKYEGFPAVVVYFPVVTVLAGLAGFHSGRRALRAGAVARDAGEDGGMSLDKLVFLNLRAEMIEPARRLQQ